MMRNGRYRVAILGATGYIGRSLAALLSNDPRVELSLYSRNTARARSVLDGVGVPGSVQVFPNGSLDAGHVDVIINATGIGSPRDLSQNPRAIFEATESVDAILLEACALNSSLRVFNISSGAVFGATTGTPISKSAQSVFNPRNMGTADFYALSKLTSEAKHRAFSEHAIVDLRAYAFFSAEVDASDAFLLSQLVRHAKSGEVFLTGPDDIVRDVCVPEHFVDVLFFLLGLPPCNTAFDMRSKATITKSALLEYFEGKWGLQSAVTGAALASPTGQKHAYYSECDALTQLGYVPRFTSLEGIDVHMRRIMCV